MPQDSPSVLIIRLDAIGDALALAPLLAAFAERAIAVDLVLRPVNAAIFAPRAARRVLVAPFELRSNAPANLAAIDAFGADLAREGYTHVLVATEDPGGYRLAAATRAPARIGFSNGWGKPLKSLWTQRLLTTSLYRPAGLDPRGPHECEVLFALGSPLLGAATPTRDAAQLRSLVLEREPARDGRAAMQITDKWERLGIRLDDVVALVRHAADIGTRFIASHVEGDYADAIEAAAGIRVERFDALEPWKNAIAAASAVVAPDSGALHVAGMTGTPVVAVFPDTSDFDLQVARWAPWAAPHRIVKARGDWPARANEALAHLLA